MSRLQRIAADLLEFYEQTDKDLQLIAELAQATQGDANLLGSVSAYEAAVKAELLEERGQVIESSVEHLTALLQGAVTSLTTTYDHVRGPSPREVDTSSCGQAASRSVAGSVSCS
ncbi:hypothetical protein APR04_006004 [Promicromonospora umidemergens]|nr:hypothetical protein [Promicromonospora umidemergens]MCP2287057.1 hypothetical protein [Promicromonospora umidemergens]